MATTSSIDYQQLLQQAQLPGLPTTALHLLELSRNPDNGPNEYAAPIEADPGLAGQILRFVNSSAIGFRSEITSVKLAINLVGIRTIRNFALWSAVFSLIPNFQKQRFQLRSLWQDSLRRGLFARTLGARMSANNAEDLFTAALLQDLAIPILVKELGDDYLALLENGDDSSRLSEREQRQFGWNHAQAGAYIARSWKLPESLCRLIENHVSIDLRWAHSRALVGQLSVSLSALLPTTLRDDWTDGETYRHLYSQLPTSCGSLEDLFNHVDREMEQFAPLLKLPTAPKTLLGHLLEASKA